MKRWKKKEQKRERERGERQRETMRKIVYGKRRKSGKKALDCPWPCVRLGGGTVPSVCLCRGERRMEKKRYKGNKTLRERHIEKRLNHNGFSLIYNKFGIKM